MRRELLAVAVPAGITLITLGDRLTRLTDPYLDDLISWAAAGQTGAGIWADPPYDPTADPGNWQTCPWCTGSPGIRAAGSRFPGGPRNGCTGPGIDLGSRPVAPRPPGQVLTDWRTWAPQPGDIIAADRILADTWRWAPGTAPQGYVDTDGWLDFPDQPDGGPVDPGMRDILAAIQTTTGPVAVVPVTARWIGPYI